MILVDANVLMYAAGAEHRHKAPSVRWLRRVATGEIEAAVDTEVLQEVLHRYRAIGRWSDGRAVYDSTRSIIPFVISITAEMTDLARDLLDEHSHLGARDALHAAALLVSGARAIASFDRDFDRVHEIRRIEPS